MQCIYMYMYMYIVYLYRYMHMRTYKYMYYVYFATGAMCGYASVSKADHHQHSHPVPHQGQHKPPYMYLPLFYFLLPCTTYPPTPSPLLPTCTQPTTYTFPSSSSYHIVHTPNH